MFKILKFASVVQRDEVLDHLCLRRTTEFFLIIRLGLMFVIQIWNRLTGKYLR